MSISSEVRNYSGQELKLLWEDILQEEQIAFLEDMVEFLTDHPTTSDENEEKAMDTFCRMIGFCQGYLNFKFGAINPELLYSLTHKEVGKVYFSQPQELCGN